MNKTLGQIGYEAYCAQSGWKSLVSGAQLPQWPEVKPEIKAAWEATGEAIVKEVKAHPTGYAPNPPL